MNYCTLSSLHAHCSDRVRMTVFPDPSHEEDIPSTQMLQDRQTNLQKMAQPSQVLKAAVQNLVNYQVLLFFYCYAYCKQTWWYMERTSLTNAIVTPQEPKQTKFLLTYVFLFIFHCVVFRATLS